MGFDQPDSSKLFGGNENPASKAWQGFAFADSQRTGWFLTAKGPPGLLQAFGPGQATKGSQPEPGILPFAKRNGCVQRAKRS